MTQKEARGKHHHRRIWTRRYDEYRDAIYTPIGQRAVVLLAASMTFFVLNVMFLLLLVVLN